MYICICKAVSESDLEKAIQTCGPSIEKVQNSCGAGTDCGSCRVKVESFVAKRASSSEPTPPSQDE